MESRKTVILDNLTILKDFIDKHLPEANAYLADCKNPEDVFSISGVSFYFINTTIINDYYRFRFERGGLEFVKNNLSRFIPDSKVLFFSYESKETIKNYLKDNWLKYDTKYFLHYPFEEAALLKISGDAKIHHLKTTEVYQKEAKRNLLKLLSSVKHDFLNRVARILPDLKAYRSALYDGKKDIEFDMDFKPEYLKGEIIKLSLKIDSETGHNEFNFDAATNESLKKISSLLKNVPDVITLFKNNQAANLRLLQNLEIFIQLIEDIKQEFENIIGYLRDGDR